MLGLALTLVLAADGGLGPRDEVLELVRRQVDAWNRGDLSGFTQAYADDAVFVSPPKVGSDGGVGADGVTRTRAEVLARYQKRYPDGKAMGRLALEPYDVRATADAVSIAARWSLGFPNKPTVSGNTVFVFVRVKGAWKIVHDASM